MAAGFLVVLTQVRQLIGGDGSRDERTHPEIVLETVYAETGMGACTLFTALCDLGPVRLGHQRPKLIPLPGSQVRGGAENWSAPMLTHAAAARAGVR